jgi:hypothetical protein
MGGRSDGRYKGGMRRIAGMGLVLVGLLPVAVLAAVAAWFWSEHMYTVGLSADLTGKAFLTSLVLGDMACLGLGTWLWRGAAKRAV